MDAEQMSKKQMARDALIGLGVLTPFDDDIELFHGRVNKTEQEFRVLPKHTDKNKNLTGLYTGSQETATNYAQSYLARASQSGQVDNELDKLEVYKIVPLKQNQFILDMCRLYKSDDYDKEFYVKLGLTQEQIDEVLAYELNDEERLRASNAINELASCYHLDELLPKYFKYPISYKILKDLEGICIKNGNEGKKPLIYDADLEEYITLQNFKETRIAKLAEHIAREQNSYSLLQQGELRFLVNRLEANIDFSEDFGFGLEFIKEFLKQENIIGMHQKVWASDIIDQKNVDICFFFNTKNIGTENQKLEKANSMEK